MNARVQAAQNKHFAIFRQWCAQNPRLAMEEQQRWSAADARIANMSLAEQAEYADYVTRKMCTEEPLDVFVEMCQGLSNETLTGKLDSCQLGNVALIVKRCLELEGTEHNELKQTTKSVYDNMMQTQRALANQVSCLIS